MGLFEIFDDGERLEQYAAIILDQRRQRHLWIDAAKFIGVVRVGIEIDEHDFGRQLLQIERDANAKTRLRSPEGEEFHYIPHVLRHPHATASPLSLHLRALARLD